MWRITANRVVTCRNISLKNVQRRFIARNKSDSNIGATKAGNKNGKEKKDWLGIVFFSSLSLVTLGLGVWQTQRYYWKVDLIESGKSQARQDAVILNDCDEILEQNGQQIKPEWKGRQVIVEEMLLGLRSAPAGRFGPMAQGMASNPQGYYVITPLHTSNGQTIFVNRGWIPRNADGWSRPQGKVKLTAVISEAEKGGYFSAVNTPNTANRRNLLWLESKTILKASDLKEDSKFLLVEATCDDSDSVKDFPAAKIIKEDGKEIEQQHYVGPETHLTYAATWYTLFVAGIVMTFKRFKR